MVSWDAIPAFAWMKARDHRWDYIPAFYDSFEVKSVFAGSSIRCFFRPSVVPTDGIGFYFCAGRLMPSIQAPGHFRVRLRVSPPSIRRPVGQPNSACALRSTDRDSNKPHLLGTVAKATRLGCGLVHFNLSFNDPAFIPSANASYAIFIAAPSGITPSCKYRHNAIASLRATATIAMRLPRLLGPRPCVRRANHCAKALPGW